ncbi:MAG TPA: acyl-CoA dehydrogenase family protein [Acidimicrobiia bacterium]|nr:acyl-CoA dehydrogenase family protein [Acidimicrobiia bacterium]
MQPYDSPEEAAFRAEARTWLEANALPRRRLPIAPSSIIAEWSPEEEERKLAEARAWQARKFDDGWAGIAWPTEFGGRGGTLLEALIFGHEEMAFDTPGDALIIGLGWVGMALMIHGSPEQRERFLRPMLRGDEVWCQLFSEPAAGSDSAAMATTAVRDGDEWVISGQKVWTTFAHRSDWGLCVARHDADLPKHRGLTAFVIDMRDPGVTCRPLRQMTDSSNFNEVFLDGVRVPDDHRVDAVGSGWRVVTTTYLYERAGGGLVATLPTPALATLLRDLGAADDPTVRSRYAALYARAEVLRYTGLRIQTALSKGQMPGTEGSILKLAWTDLLRDLYALGLEALGPAGALVGGDAPSGGEWAGAFLGTPGLRIGGGTDEVQRNLIGERVLGLPKEPRIDLDVPFREIPTSV